MQFSLGQLKSFGSVSVSLPGSLSLSSSSLGASGAETFFLRTGLDTMLWKPPSLNEFVNVVIARDSGAMEIMKKMRNHCAGMTHTI